MKALIVLLSLIASIHAGILAGQTSIQAVTVPGTCRKFKTPSKKPVRFSSQLKDIGLLPYEYYRDCESDCHELASDKNWIKYFGIRSNATHYNCYCGGHPGLILSKSCKYIKDGIDIVGLGNGDSHYLSEIKLFWEV